MEGDNLPQSILRLGSRGPEVREIQSILKVLGYYGGAVDGVFGPQTQESVRSFQRNFGLTADGVVGAATYRVLERFMRGYDVYTIKPGDTLYAIARRYYTSLEGIFTANPGVNPLALRVGQQIVVPYGIDVVRPDVDYTYEIMERDIESLKVRYPFLETGVAGKSVLGKNLYYIRLGRGPNQVFYNAAHHANEWLTTPVLMKFIEDFSRAYSRGTTIRGYNPRDIWNRSSIYIMPMVNPDGVNLVINGITPDNPYYQRVLTWNRGSLNFSGWNANIRGVDLNHNYDAGWEISKEREPYYGVYGPSPRRYSGPAPESEPESQAVVAFTRNHNFRLVLAYHSQGEVIFWNYENLQPPEARTIGEAFARASGYQLSEPAGIASYSGYKDWFIKEFRRPGYTIEVGRGTNPLPLSQFNKIYNDNIEILLLASII